MNVLGIHFGHDCSLAIVKNNKLVSNISSERLSRKKKSINLTKQMLDYVLSSAQINVRDIELIVFNEIYQHYVDGDWLKYYYNDTQLLSTNGQTVFGSDINEKGYIELCGEKINAIIIPHHLSHCAAAYYTSPFDKALCLSVDACAGFPQANSLWSLGEANSLVPVAFPGIMSANFYNSFTRDLGMGNPLYKAGSTMGWAAYGTVSEKVKNSLPEYLEKMFFGSMVKMTEPEATEWMWQKLAGHSEGVTENNKYSPHYANVAATLQYLFEESILFAISQVKHNGEIDNLCLSGGSMLNCNVNSRILKESQFNNVHLFPGCGDDGLAAGSALWGNHHYLKKTRYKYSNAGICYLGKDYPLTEVPDYEYIAKQISNGKIIAWFNGKSEVGPRALGHRSILADPRDAHNRDRLNFMIKNREWFRPFAPSVLKEHCREWFDFERESPFMLYTAKVKQPKSIPAVTHVDRSSRMQTVDSKDNLDYYNLISAFNDITGIPMLLNTSLNGKDEPIVESEQDAINFFNKAPVDMLVLSGKIIER